MRNLMFFAALCLVPACNTQAPEKAPPKPPEVLVANATLAPITDFEEFTGHTEAKNMIEVKSRVTGYLEKASFKDGDTVYEGDVLFQIDQKLYLNEVQRAKATLEQMKSRFIRFDADFRRASISRSTGAISAEEFDRVKGERGEAEASIGVAGADLHKAEINLNYTKVTVPSLNNGAPIDPKNRRSGKIGRRFKDPGNLIKADDTLLATIMTLDPMYVSFDIDERTVLTLRSLIEQKKIKSLDEMTFRFELADDEGTYPYHGKVNFEDNKIDTGTGTLTLRGEFDNKKGIAPGQFVRLRLYVGSERKAVLVPERALGTDQGQKFIYIVKTETDKEGKTIHKAEYRGGVQLELGALRDGWRVIEKGIQPGETIIWSGLQRVRKDAVITPKAQDPIGAKETKVAK